MNAILTGGAAVPLVLFFLSVAGAAEPQPLRPDLEAVAARLRLTLPAPEWRGTVATTSQAKLIRSTRTAGGGEVSEGVAPAQGEPAIEFRREVQSEKGRLAIRYRITPRRDLETAAAVLQLALPVSEHQGRGWRLFDPDDPRQGQFPRELPDPYTFLQGAGFPALACEGTAGWLVIRPDWQTVDRVHIQDNRRFGGSDYELQVYAAFPRRLIAGQHYELALTLETRSPAEIAAAWAQAEQPQRALIESLVCHQPARLVEVKPLKATVAAYEKFELAVDLEADFTNPYDPDDVALDAEFTTPGGQLERVAGFFWQGYTRQRQGQAERMRPTGAHGWRVRYCPTAPGRDRYRLTLRDGDSRVQSEEGTFEATPSAHPGMIRIAKKNARMFEFDNGQPYFAIGENVCWPGPGGTYDYDNYWRKLADNGANYARLWIGPFDCFTLERTARGADDPAGLGRYDQAASARIDYVLDLAEERGLKVMFCIDSFNSLRIKPDYPRWSENPYSAANGGPIERPEQFFTDPAARKLFQRRLRYIAARWAHNPAVLSWEFWNEVNIIEKYISADSAAWHQEMAHYLRATDPRAHLITTSWAGVEGDPAVDGLPEMDYIQSHQYGAEDEAGFMVGICREKFARFAKPHYFGEFGTGTRAEGTRQDREGIHLHNGLWSGVVSGAAGTAMIWWWDNYVEPLDLYHHFQPVAAFTAGVPLNQVEYRPGEIRGLEYLGASPPPRVEDLELRSDHASWEPAPYNQPTTVTVHPDGTLKATAPLARVLHGTRNHPKLHNPATFAVEYPRPGRFIVEVRGVSGHGGAALKIELDGQVALSKDFADDNGASGETITRYDGSYAIDVPAGKHQIRVVNDGADWFYVSYRLPGYRQRTDPGLQAWALVADDAPAGAPIALAWVKNERYNWHNHNRGEEFREVPATRLLLAGLSDGPYTVEWWDTYTGRVTARAGIAGKDGSLAIPVPALVKDAACKVFRGAEIRQAP